MSDKCVLCNEKNDVNYFKCENLCVNCCCMQADCKNCEQKQGGKINEKSKEN